LFGEISHLFFVNRLEVGHKHMIASQI
jgi:hypothetical protein